MQVILHNPASSIEMHAFQDWTFSANGRIITARVEVDGNGVEPSLGLRLVLVPLKAAFRSRSALSGRRPSSWSRSLLIYWALAGRAWVHQGYLFGEHPKRLLKGSGEDRAIEVA